MEECGIEPGSVDDGFPLPPDLSAAMPDPEKVLAWTLTVTPDPDWADCRHTVDAFVRCWIDTETGRWAVETEAGTRVFEAAIPSEVALAAITVEGNDAVTRDALVYTIDAVRAAVCDTFHNGGER